MKKTNMYKLAKGQWNPFVGCEFDCIYCKKSFKNMTKRYGMKIGCQGCIDYKPHYHSGRLNKRLPATGYMEFIFTCDTGDINFCSTEYLQKIVTVIKSYPDKTFLLQSKNPITFNRVKFPRNVILGTTIETDNDILYKTQKISNAPLPSQRYRDFLSVRHKTKMVTIEPVLPFTENLLNWVRELNPTIVWMGYDSKKCELPEPSTKEFMNLYQKIGLLHIPVIIKRGE